MALRLSFESSDRDVDDCYANLEVVGDGTLDFYIDSFRTFLLSCGFTRDTIDLYIAGTSEELTSSEECPICARDW